MCIWGKRRRWEVTEFVEPREEREKKEWTEISKIINGWVTVTVYIYTVTVTRVEIYTFLHDFKRTDVEHFWSKMRKNRVLHDFRMTDVDALILHKCSSGYFSTFF